MKLKNPRRMTPKSIRLYLQMTGTASEQFQVVRDELWTAVRESKIVILGVP